MAASKNHSYHQAKNLRQRIISLYEKVVSETNDQKEKEIYQKWIVWLKEKEILSQSKNYIQNHEN